MSISFFEDFFFQSCGGGGSTSANSNLTSDKIFPDSGGGGVHNQEPKCHVDPKFQLKLKIRGFLFTVFGKLEI